MLDGAAEEIEEAGVNVVIDEAFEVAFEADVEVAVEAVAGVPADRVPAAAFEMVGSKIFPVTGVVGVDGKLSSFRRA